MDGVRDNLRSSGQESSLFASSLTLLSPPFWTWRGLKKRFTAMPWYWGCCIFLASIFIASDVISTIAFMQVTGPHGEFHPAIRQVSIWLGPMYGPILSGAFKAGGLALVTLIVPRLTIPLTVYSAGMFTFATIWNFHSIS